MKFFIPTIGTQVRLLVDWTFTFYAEYRNRSFGKNLGYNEGYSYWGASPIGPVTLPAGTILSVSRIYIRNGKKDFDSITFSIKSCPDKKIKGRFWAKLDEVNDIECTVVKE